MKKQQETAEVTRTIHVAWWVAYILYTKLIFDVMYCNLLSRSIMLLCSHPTLQQWKLWYSCSSVLQPIWKKPH